MANDGVSRTTFGCFRALGEMEFDRLRPPRGVEGLRGLGKMVWGTRGVFMRLSLDMGVGAYGEFTPVFVVFNVVEVC